MVNNRDLEDAQIPPWLLQVVLIRIIDLHDAILILILCQLGAFHTPRHQRGLHFRIYYGILPWCAHTHLGVAESSSSQTEIRNNAWVSNFSEFSQREIVFDHFRYLIDFLPVSVAISCSISYRYRICIFY